MIELYRTTRMEWAADVLLERFRLVLIRAAYDNYVRVRFRADDVKNGMVYFGRVPSQFSRWREKGGALITWLNNNKEGPHDSILLVECPKTLRMIKNATANTRCVGVVYVPPSWRQHEQQIMKRQQHRPARLKRQLEKLGDVRYMVERLPELTRARLGRLCARQGWSRSSSSPGSPAAAERSADRIG